MDFELTEEQRALADSVKAFVDERVDPRMPEIERTNEIPKELLKEASELGLFGR
jgi:alkylation response protein AidB-like acyl-CoA dehydrogenase